MASVIVSAITVLWLVLALFFSHQGGEATARTSGVLTDLCCRLLNRFAPESTLTAQSVDALLRKSAHIAIFIILTALLCLSLFLLKRQRGWKIPPLAGFLFCLFFGWADEATKIWIEGRHFSWTDVGLNALGCCAGAAVFLIVRAIILKTGKACESR